MPKIRNVSGEDRVLANGRLVGDGEVTDVPDATNYVSQVSTWELVEPVNKRESA